jgi:hypothetical protein
MRIYTHIRTYSYADAYAQRSQCVLFHHPTLLLRPTLQDIEVGETMVDLEGRFLCVRTRETNLGGAFQVESS